MQVFFTADSKNGAMVGRRSIRLEYQMSAFSAELANSFIKPEGKLVWNDSLRLPQREFNTRHHKIMGRAFEYRRKSKEKRWGAMSRIFPKLGKVITMSAKEGGDDPDSNAKLRTAIMNARAQNMPKDKIEAAIKRASGKDAQDIVEVSYEGKGPHGVLLFVECATDNTNRSVANVKTHFNKNGGEVVNNGAFDFLFARKAVIEMEKTEGVDFDDVELELIDAGLEEFEVVDDMATAYGDYKSFGSLAQAAETLGVTIKKAGLQRVPNSPTEFNEEQLEEIEKLIDLLEEDEDVQAVYNNIA